MSLTICGADTPGMKPNKPYAFHTSFRGISGVSQGRLVFGGIPKYGVNILKGDFMKKNKSDKGDRIEGDKIILHDDGTPGPKVFKVVEIISPQSKHIYRIKKTRKRGFLFN